MVPLQTVLGSLGNLAAMKRFSWAHITWKREFKLFRCLNNLIEDFS